MNKRQFSNLLKGQILDVEHSNILAEAFSDNRKTKIMSFWSLDSETAHLDPMERYHVGQLVFILFLSRLVSTDKFLIEANICDSYSLESTSGTQQLSSFYSINKSWRIGRKTVRNFLETVFLEAKDNFVINNMRDVFHNEDGDFKRYSSHAKDILNMLHDFFEGFVVSEQEALGYRYPDSSYTPPVGLIGQLQNKFLHNLNIKIRITTSQVRDLIFLYKGRKPEWLFGNSLTWASNCIARFIKRYLNSEYQQVARPKNSGREANI